MAEMSGMDFGMMGLEGLVGHDAIGGGFGGSLVSSSFLKSQKIHQICGASRSRSAAPLLRTCSPERSSNFSAVFVKRLSSLKDQHLNSNGEEDLKSKDMTDLSGTTRTPMMPVPSEKNYIIVNYSPLTCGSDQFGPRFSNDTDLFARSWQNDKDFRFTDVVSEFAV
ncbi:hypothetical protein ACFX15_032224 [Malus domestica]